MNNKHEELNNVIIKVAKYLDGWRFKYNNEHSTFVSIISDHGMQINFDNGAENKKVRAFGSWPKIDNIRIIDHGILRSNESIPSINFNSSRPIKVIANDLIRRFIKYYIPLYMRCIEKKKELLEKINLTKIKINALQKVGNVQLKYNISGVDINPRLNLKPKHSYHCEIILNHDNTVTFQGLSYIPFDQALKIVALLNE